MNEKESWEEEFDSIWNAKKIMEISNGVIAAIPDFDAQKTFIRTLLASREQAIKAQLLAEIPKWSDMEGTPDEWDVWNKVMNQALAVINKVIPTV